MLIGGQEFLKVKGFQVAPAELEDSLLGHPDVIDSCVVGVKDEYRGEVPLAYVVLSPDTRKRVEQGPEAAVTIQESIQRVSYIASVASRTGAVG